MDLELMITRAKPDFGIRHRGYKGANTDVGLQGIYICNIFLIFFLRLSFKRNCFKLNFY